MSVNIKTWKLSSVSKDFKVGLKDYSLLYFDGTPLKDFLVNQSYVKDINSGRTPSRFNLEYWGGDYEFITMADVNTHLYELNKETVDSITEDAVIIEKTLLQVPKNSLIISNAMTIGLAFIVDRPVYINQNVFWVNIDENRINKKFLLWYMNCIIRKSFHKIYSTKYISKKELSRITIPNISLSKQTKFELDIFPIEKEIKKLEEKIISMSTIIDTVFASYFKYDYEKFNSLKHSIFYSSFLQYGNNVDLRSSAKFHRPAGEFVYQELINRPNKKIKKCLILPMITGQGIETTDYDESGEYAYVSMADISSWELDLSNIKYVSNDYANIKLTKKIKGLKTPVSTEIAVNDIVMMRSGEGGIGKVAIIKNDLKGIFCDFIIRMRFDESIINPEFAYFYFRSQYFQYLIEINKKGLGNNTNIFPNQVQEFPIPDILLSEQQEIVDMINTEIDKQKEIEKQIDEKKNEIEKILNAILK